MGDTGTIELRDGRTLAWGELGPADGFPVIALHGTPGSSHQVLVGEAALRAAGVRCIAPDRPGYGRSTYHRRRRLPEFAEDVRELADALRLERFGVVGMSGGGPHALVCARFLPERVTAVALGSGIAPVGDRGTEAGMMGPNRLFTRIARRAPMLNALPFGLMTSLGRRAPDNLLAQSGKRMPAPDAAVVADPELREAFRRDFAGASRTSGRAAAQDFGIAAGDWGFRLEEITLPVDVWHAEADVNVPPEHARRQAAAIPGATLHLLPEEGHLMCFTHLEEILRTLRAHGDEGRGPV